MRDIFTMLNQREFVEANKDSLAMLESRSEYKGRALVIWKKLNTWKGDLGSSTENPVDRFAFSQLNFFYLASNEVWMRACYKPLHSTSLEKILKA